MFCTTCGSPLPEGAKFCTTCGTPVTANTVPSVATAPCTAPVNTGIRGGYRLRCACGTCFNGANNASCPACKKTQTIDSSYGYLQLYRMGNPIGIAVGMGIYLNGTDYGHVGNQESVVIPLKPGTYKVHMVLGMNRRCTDPVVTIRPGETVCYKAHVKMGLVQNTIVLEACPSSEMPN